MAIRLASKSLASRLDAANTIHAFDAKTAAAIYRYLSRMSNRCTPFGLMAGLCCCTIGDGPTNIAVLQPRRVYVQLDGRLQGAITGMLAAKALSAHERDLRVCINPTLRYLGGEYRYSYRYTRDGLTKYQERVIGQSARLDFVRKEACNWTSLGTLVAALEETFGVDRADASRYTELLFAEQLLHTDITSCPSCDNPLSELIKRASGLPSLEPYVCDLARLTALFGEFALSEFEEKYNDMQLEVKRTFERFGLAYDDQNSINVILKNNNEHLIINRGIVSAIVKDVGNVLPILWHPAKKYATLYKRMAETFGEGTWVDLATVTDPDYGIQVGPQRRVESPLLKGALSAEVGLGQVEPVEWSAWQTWLLRHIVEAATAGREELVISEHDIKKFIPLLAAPARPYSDTGLIFGTLLPANTQSIFYLKNVFGPSATALLGRFTPGSDDIYRLCKKIAVCEAKQHADAIVAELVHVSDPRLLNISSRRPVRGYELVCGECDSVLDESAVIPVSDIIVQAKDGVINLYSRAHKMAVVVRMASAHNWGGFNDPTYSFLARLQHEGGVFSFLPQSMPFISLRYTPRIKYGSIILSLRTWRFDGQEIAKIKGADSVAMQVREILALANSVGLPRHVTVDDGDHVLEFDLRDDVSLEALAVEVKRRRFVYLSESWMECREHAALVPQPNEVLIPVELRRSSKVSALAATSVLDRRVGSLNLERLLDFESHAPWIYFELAIGEANVDRFITRYLLQLMSELVNHARVNRWFFVRYYRRERPQLRVRAEAIADIGGVRRDLHRAFLGFLRTGIVSDIAEHLYVPELDRYGGEEGLDVCHDLFYGGTQAVACALTVITASDAPEELRWRFALQFLSMRVDTAFACLSDMRDFCNHARNRYRQEMPASANVKKSVSEMYRKLRPALDEIVSGGYNKRLGDLVSDQLRLEYEIATRQLRGCVPGRMFLDILMSTIHMDCNRIFPYDERANEMMLYEVATRYYRSKAALSST